MLDARRLLAMARSSARTVRASVMSDEPKDKLAAVLHLSCGKGKGDYDRAPMYHDAIRQWFAGLSLEHAELVGTVHTIATTPRYGSLKVALDYVQDLPAAPRCPL